MEIHTYEINNLLLPITSEQPAGVDLRHDITLYDVYQKTKDARTQARSIERLQLQGKDTTTKADWFLVMKYCCEILQQQSKDLEIVAWLIEALLRLEGFSGLHKGFFLAREIIIHYWDNLYPLPDEDGIITKIAPFTGLNGEEIDGTLILPIAMVPLTEGQSIKPLALWEYQQAIELLKISDPEKKQQRINAGIPTLEMFETAASETSPIFFAKLQNDLANCINEFNALIAIFDEKCATNTPPVSRISGKLREAHECVQTIASPYLSPNISATGHTHIMTENSQISFSGTADDSNKKYRALNSGTNKQKINSRIKALSAIQEAAEYFRQSEPHSPLSYILERAAQWALLPLPELLKELIKDENALQLFCQLTGVKPK